MFCQVWQSMEGKGQTRRAYREVKGIKTLFKKLAIKNIWGHERKNKIMEQDIHNLELELENGKEQGRNGSYKGMKRGYGNKNQR